MNATAETPIAETTARKLRRRDALDERRYAKACAPLPTIRRVMPEELAPDESFVEEPTATAPEMAVRDLQSANSQNTVAGGSGLNKPIPANRLLHHNRLSCQGGAAQDDMLRSLTVNNLRKRLSFAPPPPNGEAVQKSKGKPAEKRES